MKNRLRLAITMVALCGAIPVNPTYAALDGQTAETSVGTRGVHRTGGQVRAVTFDADGHIDVPRDNNGHILIGTTFGRRGRHSSGKHHERQVCNRMESKIKEAAIEAVANAQ